MSPHNQLTKARAHYSHMTLITLDCAFRELHSLSFVKTTFATKVGEKQRLGLLNGIFHQVHYT